MNDETNEAEVAKAKAAGISALAGIVTDLGFTAVFAWVGGVALHVGFGVSVPFGAAWLLLLTGLYLAQLVTGQLAGVWHAKRVEADIRLLAATMMAQDMIHGQQESPLGDLASFLKKLDADDNSGAYL